MNALEFPETASDPFAEAVEGLSWQGLITAEERDQLLRKASPRFSQELS